MTAQESKLANAYESTITTGSETKIYAALEISDFLNLLDGNKKETN